MLYQEDKENKEERSAKGKDILCEVAAHKLKKTVLKHVKEAESDIASACAVFHKRHEEKTGKSITTISEFEKVTKAFSQLPKSEMDKLIEEGKEEDRKRNDILKEMRK
jgi:hypothetical protein